MINPLSVSAATVRAGNSEVHCLDLPACRGGEHKRLQATSTVTKLVLPSSSNHCPSSNTDHFYSQSPQHVLVRIFKKMHGMDALSQLRKTGAETSRAGPLPLKQAQKQHRDLSVKQDKDDRHQPLKYWLNCPYRVLPIQGLGFRV